MPVLAGDSRGAWDRHVLDDPRVVSLWDGSRLTGDWFGEHTVGDLGGAGGFVWDAFLGFGGGSRWQAKPTAVVAAGSPIIDNVDQLEQRFVPLLKNG